MSKTQAVRGGLLAVLAYSLVPGIPEPSVRLQATPIVSMVVLFVGYLPGSQK